MNSEQVRTWVTVLAQDMGERISRTSSFEMRITGKKTEHKRWAFTGVGQGGA